MKFVYVLEDDPKFLQEIVEAIVFIDPKIQVRTFPALDHFANWMKTMMTTGPAAIALGGEVPAFVEQEPVVEEAHQLVLVISKIEYLGVEQLELLRKTRDFFIQRKICTKEDPTAFVLTAFEDPEFNIIDLEDRILNNVIFKPFDRLILIQHLTFAIDGRHPPSKNTIASQKTPAVVEMLKDIELEELSDVGLVTRSYREITVGSISKYYGKSFKSDRQRSLFAICQSCVPHPKDPKAFLAAFTFFAADPTQISNFRKKTRDRNAQVSEFQWTQLPIGVQSPDVHVLLLDEEENTQSGLLGYLDKAFQNIQVSAYDSLAALISDLDPGQAMQQKDQSIKALGGATTVTLHFDSAGNTYLGMESDKTDTTSLFGVAESQLKSKGTWFLTAIPAAHKDRFRKMIHSGSVPEDNILPVTIEDNSFLVRASEIKKEKTRTSLVLVDPSKEEQIAWLQKNSRLQKPVQLIIASHRYFGEGAAERWKFIKESFQQKFSSTPFIMMTAKKDFTDAEERLIGTYVQDIYFKPVDRVYFIQKMKCFFPLLKEKGEKIEIRGIHIEEIIKAVNPVNVAEISEAGFIMKYYRQIAIGSFREIVLWQPYEIGAPEFLATCNFVEENSGEKGTFNCHFVFFGIADHYLKHIRVWIRDNYISSKEGQGG
ncbi:MAG: hypothetical protein COT73_02165 [Bdellovibrio sp. CG10_big_fil_rev_8_21_14_0_10_47_8]|nr:MAG: hypothetical protein COT73_02165 [Bdellovibrio sp. CG10_big_fil_rev_8_21_14_0_10_47_8]